MLPNFLRPTGSNTGWAKQYGQRCTLLSVSLDQSNGFAWLRAILKDLWASCFFEAIGSGLLTIHMHLWNHDKKLLYFSWLIRFQYQLSLYPHQYSSYYKYYPFYQKAQSTLLTLTDLILQQHTFFEKVVSSATRLGTQTVSQYVSPVLQQQSFSGWVLTPATWGHCCLQNYSATCKMEFVLGSQLLCFSRLCSQLRSLQGTDTALVKVVPLCWNPQVHFQAFSLKPLIPKFTFSLSFRLLSPAISTPACYRDCFPCNPRKKTTHICVTPMHPKL